MFKEIMEEPEAIRRTVGPRLHEGKIVFEGLHLTPEELRGMERITIIACGSSYHVGVIGKYNLEKMTRIPVEVTLASEFRYADPIVSEKTLVLVISQSGETLDTMAALREAKRRAARGSFPSSTWSEAPSRVSLTTCCIPGPGRRSPLRRRRRIPRS